MRAPQRLWTRNLRCPPCSSLHAYHFLNRPASRHTWRASVSGSYAPSRCRLTTLYFHQASSLFPSSKHSTVISFRAHPSRHWSAPPQLHYIHSTRFRITSTTVAANVAEDASLVSGHLANLLLPAVSLWEDWSRLRKTSATTATYIHKAMASRSIQHERRHCLRRKARLARYYLGR